MFDNKTVQIVVPAGPYPPCHPGAKSGSGCRGTLMPVVFYQEVGYNRIGISGAPEFTIAPSSNPSLLWKCNACGNRVGETSEMPANKKVRPKTK